VKILWVVSPYGRSFYYYPWVLQLACRMARRHDVYVMFLGSPHGFKCPRVRVSWIPSSVSTPYSSTPFRTGHMFISMLKGMDVAVVNLPDTGLVMSLAPVAPEIGDGWSKMFAIWHRDVKTTMLGIGVKAHAKFLTRVKGVIAPYPGVIPPGGFTITGGLPLIDYPYVGDSFKIVLPDNLKLWDPFPYAAFVRARMRIPVHGRPGEWAEVWDRLMSAKLDRLNRVVSWYERLFSAE